ncbi:hypothetical protein [Pseudomonas sp. RIT-PI-S]|uniref:hypothetical protein n=1 Tax=Pseudomonas sp. RIT-PI-S TaxID=3035295 RepID=UPI0021DA7E4D|nr:hypothetical protein [Pseudomonas sp. RIT-PI-S]
MPTSRLDDIHAPTWRHMLDGVDKAADYMEIRENAAKATGYLNCLTDFGLVNLGQRKAMAERISTVSRHRLEALRNAASISSDPW